MCDARFRVPRHAVRYVVQAAIAVGIAALALETWFIQGLILPLAVDGGSMAETLIGPHRRVICEACGHGFAVGLEQLPADARAVCGNCGYRDNDVQSLPDCAGQHLLVDRTAFALRKPRRWEVAVFRCPEQTNRYCVKRVVGLAGESVELRQGDVYINGQIARKNLAEQRAVAQLVHRTLASPAGKPDTRPRWRPSASRSRWQCIGTGYNLSASNNFDMPPDWLQYHHPGGAAVLDDVSYNQRESRVLCPVTDLMLSCVIRAAGCGLLLLAAGDAQDPFEVHVPSRGGAIRVWQDARLVAEVPIESGALDRPMRLELSLMDAQLLVAVRSQVRLKYPFDPNGPSADPAAPRLAIAARGLAVELRELTVWRDVYYAHRATGSWPVKRVCRLAGNEFFVLGDNSPISEDSRSWRHGGGLPDRLFVGRPLLVR